MKKVFQTALLLLLLLSLLLTVFGCKSEPGGAPKEDKTPGTGSESEANGEEPNPTPVTPPTTPAVPQPSAIVASQKELWVSVTSLSSIPAFTDSSGVNCRIVQGGCTDGTYYYVALNDGKSSDANSISAIRKFDLATGKLLATFEGLQVAHANDMTYNSVTNELIVVHNTPERWVLSVFDADTLEFKKKINIIPEIYSLAFDPYENCYWAGLSYGFDFVKLDTDFKQIGETYTGKNTGYTKQGMDVDDKYIYFCQYNKNSILVYNKQGDFVREILLSQTAKEAENIFHIGNTFYIGYYNSPGGGELFRTTLSEIEEVEVEITMTELTTIDCYTDSNDVLYKVPQGSCTDGEYIYLAMNNDISSGYLTVICKIDPRTGAVISRTAPFSAGLSNDMTYNGKTRQILLAHNTPEATKLSLYDADTLTLVETVTLDFNFFSIAYDSAKDCYYAGISSTYALAVLNADFERIGTYGGYNSGYTKQGMSCENGYIYCIQSATNSISLYRNDGCFLGQFALPVAENSAQSICRIGNTFYIGYNVSAAGGILYTATITVQSVS